MDNMNIVGGSSSHSQEQVVLEGIHSSWKSRLERISKAVCDAMNNKCPVNSFVAMKTYFTLDHNGQKNHTDKLISKEGFPGSYDKAIDPVLYSVSIPSKEYDSTLIKIVVLFKDNQKFHYASAIESSNQFSIDISTMSGTIGSDLNKVNKLVGSMFKSMGREYTSQIDENGNLK